MLYKLVVNPYLTIGRMKENTPCQEMREKPLLPQVV